MAASWDTAALLEWGVGMGKEFYAKGANVQLGPGLCLARVPQNGRNFEYAAGEDPYLGYHLVHGAIKGIQSEGVIANAKHWVWRMGCSGLFCCSVVLGCSGSFSVAHNRTPGRAHDPIGCRPARQIRSHVNHSFVRAMYTNQPFLAVFQLKCMGQLAYFGPTQRPSRPQVQNNEETNRHGVTEVVDDRTRFEMYCPGRRARLSALSVFLCKSGLYGGFCTGAQGA